MSLGNKLSVYLNRYYSYHKIKKADLSEIYKISFTYLNDLEDKIYKQPSIALRTAKIELDEIRLHYIRYECEICEYNNELKAIIKEGPKLPKDKLERITQLEERRDYLAEFIYSIEDAFTYISNFLFKHFEELESDERFIKQFARFLTKNSVGRIKSIGAQEKHNSNSFSEYILRAIEALSRKPINFSNEDGYRSHFYHVFSVLTGVSISAEDISKKGRTDLMIRGEFETKIIEFKIWGRNDYKNVVKQLVGYMTDFEKTGYLFIINENKLKKIDTEYLEQLKFPDANLIGQISKMKYNNTNYHYYQSVHRFAGKEKIIQHFIFNVNQ